MRLSENVEIKTDEVETTDKRASRMSRYSAAAAGVAALSNLDVDAAMITVIVTDTNAQNTNDYTLDLGHILSGASLRVQTSLPSFWVFDNDTDKTEFTGYSSMHSFALFSLGDTIGATLGGSKMWGGHAWSSYDWFGSGYGFLGGVRVVHGGSNYTYGWFKATHFNSTFTLSSYG